MAIYPDNQLRLTGNLGRDAETFTRENTGTITTFSMAIFRGKEKPALWVKVKYFGVPEGIASELVRGGRVTVKARLDLPEVWLSKVDGQPKCSVVAIAEEIAITPWEGKASAGDDSKPIDDYDDVAF